MYTKHSLEAENLKSTPKTKFLNYNLYDTNVLEVW